MDAPISGWNDESLLLISDTWPIFSNLSVNVGAGYMENFIQHLIINTRQFNEMSVYKVSTLAASISDQEGHKLSMIIPDF